MEMAGSGQRQRGGSARKRIRWGKPDGQGEKTEAKGIAWSTQMASRSRLS